MEVITTKIFVAILFFIVRFFVGILPVKLYHFLKRWEEEDESPNFVNEKRHNQVNCAIALCQSFGGGVLFATCFLHMMVEVFKSVEEIKRLEQINTDYPLSQIVVCIGFFFIYFLEEMSHWCIAKIPAEPCEKKVVRNLRKRTITPVLNKNVSPIKDFIIEEVSRADIDKTDENTDKPLESVESTENEKNEYNTANNSKNMQESSDPKTMQQIMRCILVVMALSFHAIFEGLSIGLQNDIATIWYLFTAVTIHSATILFCIGLELLLAKTKTKIIVMQMFILALTSPFGVILGLLITAKSDMDSKVKSASVVILEGLSTGTILYITFFEVLNREKDRRVYRLSRGLCIISGFTFMALLQYYELSEYREM